MDSNSPSEGPWVPVRLGRAIRAFLSEPSRQDRPAMAIAPPVDVILRALPPLLRSNWSEEPFDYGLLQMKAWQCMKKRIGARLWLRTFAKRHDLEDSWVMAAIERKQNRQGKFGFETKLAPETGLEPVTRRLTAGCSTIELLWNPNR